MLLVDRSLEMMWIDDNVLQLGPPLPPKAFPNVLYTVEKLPRVVAGWSEDAQRSATLVVYINVYYRSNLGRHQVVYSTKVNNQMSLIVASGTALLTYSATSLNDTEETDDIEPNRSPACHQQHIY